MALATERSSLQVWATDRSPDALEVARANLAGIGRAGTRVRIAHGDWFDALPEELRGAVDVVVANPPYVGASEPLPDEVSDWEPRDALIAGPTGLEAIERIIDQVPEWLADRGAIVLEIGETQGERVLARARECFSEAAVHPDLTGRPRVLVARR